jgi:hypothetical protein
MIGTSLPNSPVNASGLRAWGCVPVSPRIIKSGKGGNEKGQVLEVPKDEIGLPTTFTTRTRTPSSWSSFAAAYHISHINFTPLQGNREVTHDDFSGSLNADSNKRDVWAGPFVSGIPPPDGCAYGESSNANGDSREKREHTCNAVAVRLLSRKERSRLRFAADNLTIHTHPMSTPESHTIRQDENRTKLT